MKLTQVQNCRKLCLCLIPLIAFVLILGPVQAQNTIKSISGTVVDEAGEPIIGANIVEVGSITNGAITDIDGKFTLQISSAASIQVSYVGYVTKTVSIGTQSVFNIVLLEDSQTLTDVVVVGYGTQKKLTLTGAVSAISAKEIVATKSPNVQNMLSGKIAGVQITQKSSEPGRFDNNLQIRGMGAPLVIIDGVPRDNYQRLDPNDIETISVLKDASAAIYGVRAANGVLLITTKRGQKSKEFALEYTGYVGFQNMIGQPKAMNAVEFMQIQNEKLMNQFRYDGSGNIAYSKEQIDEYLTGKKISTPWESTTLRNTAPQTQHSFSASGGTDKINYYVNFGYLNQNGFFKSNDLKYERFNLRSNVSAELAKGLRAEVLLSGLMDEKQSPSQWDVWNLFKGYWTQIPLNPMYWDEEKQFPFNAADGLHPDFFTSVEKSGYQKRAKKAFNSTMSLEWIVPWVEGLKAKGMYSFDYNEDENKLWRKQFMMYSAYNPVTNTGTPSPSRDNSQLERQWFGYTTSQLQLALNYNRIFNQVHNVGALLLYEENTRSADNFRARRDFSFDAVDQLFAGNSTNQQGTMDSGQLYKFTNKALVGRFNYDYESKYMAEFSFRYDGSSKFRSGSQWGFFPAGSIGWRMSEEDFIRDGSLSKVISNLKIRASYGLMGDDNASSYQFLTGYNYPSGGYVFGNNFINAFGMRGMPNLGITWFKSAMLDIGVDFELWNGLLGGIVDVYQRDRSNLLTTRAESLPGVVGANLPQENLNSDRTQGLEITLTHRNKIGDISYNITGNVGFARTKWKYRETARQSNSYNNWMNNYNNRWNDLWWGIDYAGRFQSMEEIANADAIYDGFGNARLLPGDPKYIDWNEDGVIDDNDRHPVQYNTAIDKANKNGGMPMINYGFTLGVEWRGFDLNAVFQGTGMSWIRYPEQLEMPLPWNRNGLSMFMDRWHRKDQFDVNSEWVPGYYPSTFRDNDRSGHITSKESAYNITNASYFRLKSLEIGYTLPTQIVRHAGIKRARVFLNAYNLFTITGVKYVDPEHTGDEYAYTYPLSQNFNFGVNVTF